jgi:hypothetical protein
MLLFLGFPESNLLIHQHNVASVADFDQHGFQYLSAVMALYSMRGHSNAMHQNQG